MFINLNWATMGIAQPPTIEALVGLATRNGYGGVDLPGHALLSTASADHARAVVNSAGLKWGLFWLPGQFLASDDATFEQEMDRLIAIAPHVARAGGRATYQHVWPASDTLDYAVNFAHHVRRLRRMSDILWPLGIRVGLEFIGGTEKRRKSPFPFVYRLPETLELADAVGPGVGIALDAYHWWTSGGTLDDLRHIPDVNRIVNVHLSDGVTGRPRDEQKDLERAMPGSTGLVDLTGFLGVLRERHYDGPVICEPFDPSRKRFTQTPADDVAQEVMNVMRPLVSPTP